MSVTDKNEGVLLGWLLTRRERAFLRAAIGQLMSFSDHARNDPERGIAYQTHDYLELIDWSGRAIIEGKPVEIPDDLLPILARLKIDPDICTRFINRTQLLACEASGRYKGRI